MESIKKQKEFELLVKSLAMAIHSFYLRQIINEELSKEIYTKNRFLWDTISLGLEQSYLIGLAKFFERPRELDESISVYYFFDFGNNDSINKIKKFRNKLIAHHDKKLTNDSFLEDLRMNDSEIEEMFAMAMQAIEDLKEKFGYKWDDHVITGFPVDKEILRKQFKNLVNK